LKLIPISFDEKYYERVENTTREVKPERLKQFLNMFKKG